MNEILQERLKQLITPTVDNWRDELEVIVTAHLPEIIRMLGHKPIDGDDPVVQRKIDEAIDMAFVLLLISFSAQYAQSAGFPVSHLVDAVAFVSARKSSSTT